MKSISIFVYSIFLSIFSFAQITLETDRVGINTENPTATLEVHDPSTFTEVLIQNVNASRLTIDGGSPSIQWNVAGSRKAYANWGNDALRIYSSPPSPPPFSFSTPTLNLTEDRKVGINMGLVGNPTEALDVNGRIKVGNSSDTSATAGTIRWNAAVQDFEGYDGTEWLSLTAGAQPVINPGGIERISDVQYFTAPIIGPNGPLFTFFAYDVSISGTRAVAGAPNTFGLGYITCYEKSGSEWTETQILTPADIDTFENFGLAVAMEGDWLVASATGHNIDSVDQGAVYVYQHNGSEWVQHQKLTLSNPRKKDFFGSSLELKGTQLFIGCEGRHNNSNVKTGALMVYNLVGGNWNFGGITYYPLNGEENERFGAAVAMNGDHLIVGSPGRDTFGVDRGIAYVYDRNGSLYVNPQAISISSNAGGLSAANFGQAVATSGEYVGVTRRTGGKEIRVWIEDSDGDHKEYLTVPYQGFFDSGNEQDRRYRDIDMEGDYLIAGLAGFDGGSNCSEEMEGVGKVIIMKQQGNTWFKCDEFLDPSGTPDQGDRMSVAIAPDGQFIIGFPSTGYGPKLVIGQVEE